MTLHDCAPVPTLPDCAAALARIRPTLPQDEQYFVTRLEQQCREFQRNKALAPLIERTIRKIEATSQEK